MEMQEEVMEFPQMPARNTDLLARFPPETAYKEVNGDPYLSIDYVKATADKVWGKGNWSINPDSRTLRFEEVTNPVTGKPMGRLCLIEVTVLVRGCLPRTELGHDMVKFGGDRGELKESQSIKVVTNAVNNAIAIGAKRAFAQYGPAFQNKKEESVRQARLEQKKKSTTSESETGKADEPAASGPTVVSNSVRSANSEGVVEHEARVSSGKPYLELIKPPPAATDPWEARSSNADQASTTAGFNLASEQRQGATTSQAMSDRQMQQIESLAQQKDYTIEGGVMKSKTFQNFGISRFEEMNQEQAGLIIRLLDEAKPRLTKTEARAG